jgi:hypothetical protein
MAFGPRRGREGILFFDNRIWFWKCESFVLFGGPGWIIGWRRSLVLLNWWCCGFGPAVSLVEWDARAALLTLGESLGLVGALALICSLGGC